MTKKIVIKKGLINRVIMFLTLSDIFTWGMYFVVNSIVGIYLAKKLDGNAVTYIGIGMGAYYLAKGVLQIPIGILTDKIIGDNDDIIVLLTGNILMGIPYFFYPTLNSPFLFYFLQFMMGVGAAMNLVTWRKLFAKNLDRGKEGFDYAIYDTIMSVIMIGMSLVVGYIANINQYYFDLVMYATGIIFLLSTIWIISIYFDTARNKI